MSKTIFHPGKAVTTNWLNSSQYLGPSNPGVVFVANPVNDYEYPLLKAPSFDLPNMLGYFVGTTTNQTINGLKNFSVIPTFPTSTLNSGFQAVNVSRLRSDIDASEVSTNQNITTLNTQLTASIASVNTTLTTNLANVNTTLTANITGVNSNLTALSALIPNTYVGLTNAQTISGAKTFSNISVPIEPLSNLGPVSKQFFDNRTVQVTGDQVVNGTKTFAASPQVPNPDSGGDAVNFQTLLNSIGGIVNPNISEGCIRLGTIQIIFGSTNIIGAWQNGGGLQETTTFISVAPSSAPFVSIVGAGTALDRLCLLQTRIALTSVEFFGDSPGGNIFQADNGVVRWVVIGYTA